MHHHYCWRVWGRTEGAAPVRSHSPTGVSVGVVDDGADEVEAVVLDTDGAAARISDADCAALPAPAISGPAGST